MKIVGLTGGIGSGKSTVLQMFQDLGAVIYISDIEAKKLMISDKDLIADIIHLFGEKAYVNNALNTNYIDSIVFNDSTKLEKLNTLVHPKVREHFNNFIHKTTADIIIYEAAILFESGSNEICDFVITVTSNFNTKVDRIMKRDGVSKQQILDRMKHQSNDEFKIKNSNFVITNNSLLYTKMQVTTIYNLLLM